MTDNAPETLPPPPSTISGPPTVDQETRPQAPPPQTQRDAPIDPRVVALRGLFPDYDDIILQSVLESVNWNQDRAVDTLLTMSDPEYKPEPQPEQQAPVPAPILSQEDLDEQFARQLALQEQQQAQSQWSGNGAGRGARTAAGGTVPYDPYRHGGQPQGWAPPPQGGAQGQGQGQGPDFQEQFNKVAEAGKKTFGSLFNKVKAKLQEFEQGRPAGASGSSSQSQGHPTNWTPGPGSYYGPPEPAQPNAQASYYSPLNHPSPSPPSHTTSPQPHFASVAAVTTPPASLGTTTNNNNNSTGNAATPSAPAPSTTARAVSPGPTAAQPIDGGKLGLLPKRPVSLLRETPLPSESGSAAKATPAAGADKDKDHTKGYSVDDDDGLEYAENPFDEGKK